MTLKNILSRYRLNFGGKTLKRKILVIESDDWGTIRMPSKKTYDTLAQQGIRVDKCPFCRFDSLATPDDLAALFEVLTKHKDKNGKSAILTANTIVANPDFTKIAADKFKTYHFENFTETLQNTPGRSGSFTLWQEGIRAGIFKPQFHGREHLQYHRWLENLRGKSPQTLLAFEQRVFGLSTNVVDEKRRSYMAALDCDNAAQAAENKRTLAEGIDIFQDIFQTTPTSFIAPNYVWSNTLEETLAQKGITHLQSSAYQILPISEQTESRKTIRRKNGETNSNGQNYTMRNVNFEPASAARDILQDSLQQVNIAFRMRQPAVINAHRLNFIGAIIPENRTKNLQTLDKFLGAILKKHPQTEFMSSDELSQVYKNKNA